MLHSLARIIFGNTFTPCNIYMMVRGHSLNLPLRIFALVTIWKLLDWTVDTHRLSRSTWCGVIQQCCKWVVQWSPKSTRILCDETPLRSPWYTPGWLELIPPWRDPWRQLQMVSGSSAATLVLFIFSIVCVIYPFSFLALLPYLGRKRIYINLTTAPIIAIAILWAAQCLGPSVVSVVSMLHTWSDDSNL